MKEILKSKEEIVLSQYKKNSTDSEVGFSKEHVDTGLFSTVNNSNECENFGVISL